MQINRQQLLQEIVLREHIQKLIREKSYSWANNQTKLLEEQQLRSAIQNFVADSLNETENKEEVAISLVRDTLLAVVKIIKSDQSKFKDTEVQEGFIKFCLLALQNDFEENRGEEGDEAPEAQILAPEEDELVLQEFANDGDDNLDIRIKPSDDPMFIPDEEEPEEEPEEEIDDKEKREGELFLTLTDSEKVGFRYAKETTWPKVTKQIKRIHKMALPDLEIANIYEEWLTKNIELHGKNTKEESTFNEESEENTEF
jgi:uncharacterized protein involved in tolerance to divalent cations